MQIKSAGLGKFLAEWAKWGVGRGLEAANRTRHSSGSWNPFCFCSERTKQQRSALRQ
ncbi:hypothetical protein [Lysobacter soli]|uniref:hypothetical protein n=1 Tax=Lysobacter soli TaxID=453783 RepID=UPI0015F26A2A|nr:hypothetical protein [Lysobacter soli]